MALILEDGTAPDGANSYADEDTLGTYTDYRAITLAAGDAEAALIRATVALDATYRGRFGGYRTNGRNQSLEWPRTAAYDAEGNAIAGDEIPVEIINATCEFAIRELIEAGSTMPDLERGGAIKRLKAGSVEVEYAGNAGNATVFQIVDGILAGLLGSPVASFVGRAVRG